MTAALRILPFDELDRHHAQARVCLDTAMADGDEAVYRRAGRLEANVRAEKVRRARCRKLRDNMHRQKFAAGVVVE